MRTMMLFIPGSPTLSTLNVYPGIALAETAKYPASSQDRLHCSGGGFELRFGRTTEPLGQREGHTDGG
jgi:hypothetical protein